MHPNQWSDHQNAWSCFTGNVSRTNSCRSVNMLWSEYGDHFLAYHQLFFLAGSWKKMQGNCFEYITLCNKFFLCTCTVMYILPTSSFIRKKTILMGQAEEEKNETLKVDVLEAKFSKRLQIFDNYLMKSFKRCFGVSLCTRLEKRNQSYFLEWIFVLWNYY